MWKNYAKTEEIIINNKVMRKHEKSISKIRLNAKLIEGLFKEGIIEPTPVQEQVIPKALLNLDIVAESETGSGKL